MFHMKQRKEINVDFKSIFVYNTPFHNINLSIYSVAPKKKKEGGKEEEKKRRIELCTVFKGEWKFAGLHSSFIELCLEWDFD